MLRKRISAALAAIITLASCGTAFAVYDADVIPVQTEIQDELSIAESRPQTSKFSYNLDGEELTVSLNGQTIKNTTDEDINVFIAVYEADILCKAKRYTVSADYPEVNLKDWKTTYSGDKDALKVKAFIWTADGNCKPIEEASELSDISGTVYKAFGRVVATSTGSNLRPGEVMFQIEQSDDFDGREINKSLDNIETITAQTGSTNAKDMLFIYSEAFIAKAVDGTFAIVSIESCDPSQTVTFAAKDVADDDAIIGIDYSGNRKLPVYESDISSSTIKYDLADDVKLYVNGVEDMTSASLNEKIADYILANPTGAVQLIDQTAVGSTSKDGKYDKIMVTFYVDAVVDYVTATSSTARIYFKNSQINAMRMEWDPEDKDIEVKFTKDGAEIAYTDLAEYDVLSIKYNMVEQGVASDALTDCDFYEVLVSRNVVEGSIIGKDFYDQTVKVNGNDYNLIYNDGVYSTKTWSMTSTYDCELGTYYKLFLDAFGYVAHFDELELPKDYGVIVAMYTNSGDDYPTVRLVTADGEIVSYECTDSLEAHRFYNYAVNGNPYGSASYTSFNKNTPAVKDNILAGNTVCTYKLTDGKIRFDQAFNTGYGGADLEYKASSSKIGSYSIDENTRIIDMDEYMHNGSDKVLTLSAADFDDKAAYTAYLFDKNSDGVYRFAIVFHGAVEGIYDVYGQVTDNAQTSSDYKEDEIGFEITDDDELNGKHTMNVGKTDAADIIGKYCEATIMVMKNGRIKILSISPEETNYGVIVSMYQTSGDDYPTVRLVTADGEIVSYECKDMTEATMFYNYAVNGNPYGSASYTSFNKNVPTVMDNILAGNTVCTYKLTNGRIRFDNSLYDNGGTDLEYKASTSEIGAFAIDENTRIIDMDEYMHNGSDKVSTLSAADFEDEAAYTAYLFDKNTDGVYRFAIVFHGAVEGIYDVYGQVTDNAQTSSNYKEDEIGFERTDDDELNGKHTMNVGNTDAADMIGKYCEATILVMKNGRIKILSISPEETNYGVIVAMYKSSGDDYPTVRLVTANGEIVSYECKDMTEANRLYNYAVSGNPYGSASYTSFNKYTPTVKANILAGDTVCTYKLADGRIRFDNALYGNGGTDLEYNASTSEIGAFTIDENTRIIDMDEYMHNGSDKVPTLSAADFEDEAIYDAYFFDKNNDSVYNFGIVFEGTSSIRPESRLAVVKKVNGQADTNGTTTWSYTVLRAGEEVEVRIDDSTALLPEGAVIAYIVNSDGYVDSDRLYVLYEPASTYYYNLETILSNNDFCGSQLDNVNMVTDWNKNHGKYEIAYNGRTSYSKDVFAYVGIVYKTNGNHLELFTKKTGNVSSTLTDIEDISLSGATVYLYDYNYKSGKGARVSVATATQSDSIYNVTYDDADKTQVNWYKVIDNDATPLLAFVKEVDGEATDVILFIAK